MVTLELNNSSKKVAIMTYDHFVAPEVRTGLGNWLKAFSIEEMVIAKRAKMTLFEIFKCLEISEARKLPLDEVLSMMAQFKQSTEHLLYKSDFQPA